MDPELIALHRHWLAADAVQYHLRRSLDSVSTEIPGFSNELVKLGMRQSAFFVLSVWYGLLYVTIEGYQELGFSDSALDELLKHENYLSSLRRFRNGTFHYQGEPISPKLLEFLEIPDSEQWVRRINREFRNFFQRRLDIWPQTEHTRSR